jgi:hypothetical protein
VHLPEVLEAGRREEHAHRIRLASLARAVVDDRRARVERMHERRRVRNRLAVMRDDEQVRRAERLFGHIRSSSLL